MAEDSAISWTDHTFNPWIGCMRVGPACDHCYAANLMGATGTRYKRVVWGEPGVGEGERIRTSESTWAQPVKWNKKAKERFGATGERTFVFCASLADVFDNAVPTEWRRDLFDLIRATPNLTWLLLTKRPQNIVKLFNAACYEPGSESADAELGRRPWPRNAAIGCTVVTQEEANRDVPRLLAAKAALKPAFAFVSMEPLLGPVDLLPWLPHDPVHSGLPSERGVRLSGGPDGRAGGRRAGGHLEGGGPSLGSVERQDEADPMRTAPSGARLGEIPSGQGDDRRQAGSRPSAPSGLSASQRPDTGGADGQSRGRPEEAQRSEQPGAGHALGATASLDPRSGQRPTAEPALDWIISGGETDQGGSNARPSHTEWFRSLRDQCAAAGTAYHHKQNGEFSRVLVEPIGSGLRKNEVRLHVDGTTNGDGMGGPNSMTMRKIGKKAAGRLLDGVEHNARPEVRA